MENRPVIQAVAETGKRELAATISTAIEAALERLGRRGRTIVVQGDLTINVNMEAKGGGAGIVNIDVRVDR